MWSAATVMAGAAESAVTVGSGPDGCHRTSVAAAITASEVTSAKRWIGDRLVVWHVVQVGMTVSPVKVVGMLDLDLG
jgi:hypothetical protein